MRRLVTMNASCLWLMITASRQIQLQFDQSCLCCSFPKHPQKRTSGGCFSSDLAYDFSIFFLNLLEEQTIRRIDTANLQQLPQSPPASCCLHLAYDIKRWVGKIT